MMQRSRWATATTNDATITMGNGNSESATVIGTLPGTVCDQYGNELNKVAIENVSYLPNETINLFSLTQNDPQRMGHGQ